MYVHAGCLTRTSHFSKISPYTRNELDFKLGLTHSIYLTACSGVHRLSTSTLLPTSDKSARPAPDASYNCTPGLTGEVCRKSSLAHVVSGEGSINCGRRRSDRGF